MTRCGRCSSTSFRVLTGGVVLGFRVICAQCKRCVEMFDVKQAFERIAEKEEEE